MAQLKLLVGTAGTGKTWRVVDEIASKLSANPLPGGGSPPLLVIVPEQQAVQFETAIMKRLLALTGTTETATARLTVASFSRLARLIGERRAGPKKSLGSVERRMLVWKLLPATSSRGALAGAYSDAIAELLAYGADPQEFKARVQEIGNGSGAFEHPWEELAKLYGEFQNQCMQIGYELSPPGSQISDLADGGWWGGLSTTEVWVDGFSGFTPPEQAALVSILKACSIMTATIMMDPARVAGPGPQDSADWFEPTRELMGLWREIAENAGAEAKQEFLNEKMRWPDAAGIKAITSFDGAAGGEVSAIACPDEKAEVDAAAGLVKDLVAEGYRYSDISLATRSLEPYAEQLQSRFQECGIPLYIDKRAGIAHHPAVEYFKCALKLALRVGAFEDMVSMLRTGMLPGPEGQAYSECLGQVVHYVTEHSLKPWKALGDAAWDRHRLLVEGNRPRAEEQEEAAAFLLGLNSWRKEFFKGINTLRGRLDSMSPEARTVEGVLSAAWEELVESNTRVASSICGDHIPGVAPGPSISQVLEAMAGQVQALASIGGELVLPARELAAWIEFALEELNVGYPPQVIDCVMATEAERGRQPEVKAIILLGLAEGCWPADAGDTPVLSREVRRQLNAGGRIIPGGPWESSQREPYNAFVAFTRPSERLFMLRPVADSEGRLRQPSPFYSYILSSHSIGETKFRNDPHNIAEQVISPSDVAVLAATRPRLPGIEKLIAEVRGSSQAGLPGGIANQLGAANWVRQTSNGSTKGFLARDIVLGSIKGNERDGLDFSATRLETYAACPYRHFAKYLLKLQDRPQSPVDARSIGGFYHGVLEKAVSNLLESGYDWLHGDKSVLRDEVRAVLAGMGGTIPGFDSREREPYLIERADIVLSRLAVEMLSSMRERGQVPVGTEIRFGPSEGSLPAVEIEMPGAKLKISGFIDRLDIGPGSASVVDYKLKGKAIDWGMFKAGHQIQLMVYLLAVSGREYVARHGSAVLQQVNAEYQSIEIEWNGQSGSCKSQPLVTEKMAGGEPGIVDAILDDTRQVVAEIAQRLLSGEVAAKPLKKQSGGWTACGRCDYRAVCRFDPATNPDYWIVESLSATAYMNQLLAGHTEGDGGS